jgi:hypothetical protein
MGYATTLATAPASAIHALRHLGLSERLLALYGYGIEGCAERNEEQVRAVLGELIGTLNFDYGEAADGFHRLYTFCLERTGEGEFDQVGFILGDLHATWAGALEAASA